MEMYGISEDDDDLINRDLFQDINLNGSVSVVGHQHSHNNILIRNPNVLKES